jgi:hypothetical protein
MAGVTTLTNRINDIIRRMKENIPHAETLKTCFGILAIMSREDASKGLIAKEGMEILLNGMQTHLDKVDVQEAGCDLIWSLAFNNAPVKEIVGKYGGATVIVKGTFTLLNYILDIIDIFIVFCCARNVFSYPPFLFSPISSYSTQAAPRVSRVSQVSLRIHI